MRGVITDKLTQNARYCKESWRSHHYRARNIRYAVVYPSQKLARNGEIRYQVKILIYMCTKPLWKPYNYVYVCKILLLWLFCNVVIKYFLLCWLLCSLDVQSYWTNKSLHIQILSLYHLHILHKCSCAMITMWMCFVLVLVWYGFELRYFLRRYFCLVTRLSSISMFQYFPY